MSAKNYIQSFGEEVANSVSHGVMAAAMLAALPYAAVRSYLHGGLQISIGTSIFVISIFLMLLASTLYHSMAPESRQKHILHILDHICIYLAIAGTYTPVALSVIGGWQGITIVVLQWAAVIFGVFYKSLSRRSIPAVSLTIYLVMGWTLVLFLPRFVGNASRELIALIAAGGVFYTAGAVIYARKAFRYHHLVWHLLIDLAVAAHFTAIVYCIR